MNQEPVDPSQRVLACGCLATLILFGLAATFALVAWVLAHV